METMKRLSDTHLAFFALMVIAVFLPAEAWASAGTGGGLPYESGLGKLRASVTGPIAFAFSIIGIAAAGMTLVFGGGLNGFFRNFLVLILVIALIVAANNVLSTLFGVSAVIEPYLESAPELIQETLKLDSVVTNDGAIG